MSEYRVYDAIVIGSGQGGTPLAGALASKGMKTALVEMREVGGTCVNYGCTPTKTMVASARAAFVAGRSPDYGVRARLESPLVDIGRIRERKRAIVASFREGSERRIAENQNLELVRGSASFVAPNRVLVNEASKGNIELTSPMIFVNTGTRPARPEVPGLSEIDVLDNESAMELDHLPEHLIIVGGGYVGVEFAQMFRRFGARVTLIHHSEQVLSREDPDISEAVADLLRGEGIELLLGGEPIEVARGPSVRVRIGGGERTIEGSDLLLAAGRIPNTDVLNPGAAGLKTDEKGYLKVNERLETGVEGIWALGDVKGGPAFTHVSYDDYRVLSRNLLGEGGASIENRVLPYTVFTDPQLGRVGSSERQARSSGRPFRVASIPMSWVARALETEETTGFMKAVVDSESDRILGFAMLGMQAGEVASAVQIAMMGDLPYTALRDGMFSHPTFMESLNTLFSSFQD